MSTKYKIWAPVFNYKGSYGVSTKDKIHTGIDQNETDFFPIEENYAKVARDWTSQYTTPLNLSYRIQRDMAMDMGNPKEKLPEDFVSAKLIDAVPIFGYSHPPDMSLPEDFKQNDQVLLTQQAFLNAQRQDQMFTNPNYFDKQVSESGGSEPEVKELNTDKRGKGNKPLGQMEFYSMDGSAAGMESNFLGSEEGDESYRVMSIETMVAF